MGLKPEVESAAQVKSAKYGNDSAQRRSAAQRGDPTTTRCSVSAMGRGGIEEEGERAEAGAAAEHTQK